MGDSEQSGTRAERPGNEASCEVFSTIFREARRRGVPLERLVDNTGYQAEELLEPGRRIDWDDLRRLMDNIGEVWSPEELFEVGVAFTEFPWGRALSFIARLFLEPIDLYIWIGDDRQRGTRGVFRCMRDDVEECGPDHIVVTTRVLEGYEPIRTMEHIAHGSRAAMPALVGLPHARVEMTRLPDGARYDIHLPTRGSSSSWRRLLLAPLFTREGTRSLRKAQQDLALKDKKIDEGRRKLLSEISDRQQAEQALRASEARFRVLVENAQDLIVEIDAEGRCIYASPNHFDLLGLRPDEMLGRPVHERIHPDDLKTMLDPTSAADLERGRFRATYRYRHANGDWIWLEHTSSRYEGIDGKTHLVTIARDITERRRLEERDRALQQREHEERYEQLEKKLALETMIADLSQRFLDLPNEDVRDEIHDSLASVGELVDSERAYLYTMDIANERLDGLYQWFAPEVEIEDWIPDSIEKWRSTGAFKGPTYAYSSLKALRGEVVNAPRVVDLPDEAASEREDLLARGVKSYLSIPLRSGRDYLGFLGLECRSREQSWSDETIVLLGLVGQIFMSALRRQRAEEALRESQRQLIQSQKMEALGRLAGGIAHDFNNMLMVISGYAEALLDETVDEDSSHEDLTEILTTAERAGALTQQLLAFSRRQPYLPEPLDLNEVVDGLKSMLARVIGEDITLSAETEEELATIHGDSGQIEQLLINLAVNARDAMPNGGELTVYTRNREFDAHEAHVHELPRPGRYVELGVRDTGVGIREEERNLIFEPFYTTKEVGRGTGLGLSIVYGIVQQNSGNIDVVTEVGRGSTFRIWFPVHGGEARRTTTYRTAPTTDGNETILLVEDETAVRHLVRRVLERRGYTILEAHDGVDGLRIALDHAGPIDLLVSDIVMPNKGGIEMARELREAHPDLRVLFMSGYADERIDDLRSSLPGAAILSKPFQSEALLAAVRSQLNAKPEELPPPSA